MTNQAMIQRNRVREIVEREEMAELARLYPDQRHFASSHFAVAVAERVARAVLETVFAELEYMDDETARSSAIHLRRHFGVDDE